MSVTGLENSKIYVAGHRGMVGAAVLRSLRDEGCERIVFRTSGELDLCDQSATDAFFDAEKPDVVIVAAARVGGIHANDTYPAEFIRDNLAIALNCVHSAWRHGVKRLLMLGSTCIYPKFAPQPIEEASLLTGPLEPTNEAYAIAKIAGLKLCEFYRRQYGVCFHSAMPTNLYGPGDNYHPENSHVIPAMIRRFHEAKERGDASVTIWGTGSPRREFLYADDLARAVVHLLRIENPPDLVNVGYGADVTIQELAEKVAAAVGFTGRIENDLSKPDGTPRKLADTSRLRETGWAPRVSLEDGLMEAYRSFLEETRSGLVRAK